MNLTQLTSIISRAHQRRLSGGITCSQLTISDNGHRELTVSGDVTITLKVFDLTTKGASRIHRLMNSTRAIIAEKLNGDSGVTGGVFTRRFDPNKKKFINENEIYTIAYNLHYIVKLEQISMLNQLSGNDFVLAIADKITYQTDRSLSAGLTVFGGGPSSISYDAWNKYPHLGAHEFFHALKLGDLQDKKAAKNLMYEYVGSDQSQFTNNQRLSLNRYIIRNLDEMYSSPYSNPNLNTVANLRNFLNDSKNGIQYNKNKFR